MKNWVNENQLRTAIINYGGIIKSRYSDQYSKWRTIKFPENVDIISILNQLKNNSLFEYVEYNFVYQPQGEVIPNDPLFNQQWYLKNTGQNGGTPGADIKATYAWQYTMGSFDVIIAVIDDGIAVDSMNNLVHPDLDDPNRIILGIDVSNTTPNFFGDHGTRVIGVVGAETNNNVGISGVCPNCKILVVKGIRDDYGDSIQQDSLYSSDIFSSILYIINYKNQNPNNKFIINLSSAINVHSNQLEEAIKLANDNGILIVVSAGNEFRQWYPAIYSLKYNNVVAVSATDKNDNFYIFYNSGSYINVSAPGVEIYTTDWPGDLYKYWKGTSFSAPMVAGLAGLILSLEYYEPSLIRELLHISTKRFPYLSYDTLYGWGRIDCKVALELIIDRPLNCFVRNINNRPYITWDSNRNIYEDYNGFAIYKSVISGNQNSPYFLVGVVDSSKNYFIDYSEYIYPPGLGENSKRLRYRVSKFYVGSSDTLFTAKSNFAEIRVGGSSLEKKYKSIDEKLELFPVPSNYFLNVKYYSSENENISIMVLDILGRVVEEFECFSNAGENFYKFNLNRLSSGKYILKLKSSHRVLAKTFTIIK